MWTASSQESFEQLKTVLVTPLVLAFPDYDTLFVLHTDMSKLAIGVVLSQGQAGKERVIAYASWRLSGSERNYSVCEWECLSIVYWITFFHHYLHGSKFIVMTDHAALRWLMEAREQRGRLACWALKLQPYEFEIVHCAGSKHANADTMTRLPVVQENDIIVVVVTMRPVQRAALAGCEFVQQVATDPYSDRTAKLAKAPPTTGEEPHHNQTHQQELNSDSSGPVSELGEGREITSEDSQPNRDNLSGGSNMQQPGDESKETTADWPFNENWERSWLATEDWFSEASPAPDNRNDMMLLSGGAHRSDSGNGHEFDLLFARLA